MRCGHRYSSLAERPSSAARRTRLRKVGPLGTAPFMETALLPPLSRDCQPTRTGSPGSRGYRCNSIRRKDDPRRLACERPRHTTQEKLHGQFATHRSLLPADGSARLPSLTRFQLFDMATVLMLVQWNIDRGMGVHDRATVNAVNTSLLWIRNHAQEASVDDVRSHFAAAARATAHILSHNAGEPYPKSHQLLG